jgi:multidrug resistance efflux pump
MTLLPKDLISKLPHMLFGGGLGAGAAIAYLLADKEPKALIETFQHWGAPAMLALVALVFVSQGAGRVLDLGEKMLISTEKNATAQQQLADAVQALVNKDDREKEEQRRLLSYVGSQQEKILTAIEDLKQTGTRSRGASA